MNAIPPKGLDPQAEAEKPRRRAAVGLDDPDAVPADADAAETPPAPEPRRGARIAVPAHLSAIEVTLSVEVGSLRLPLRDLLVVEPGQLFPLDRMTAEPVDVLVNGRKFARGEVVAIGERYGVRLTSLADTQD